MFNTPPRDKAEVTRQAIQRAAFQLFQERGYQATTMRAIASLAGVSTGNAYYYFKSKEDLVFSFYALTYAEQLRASQVAANSAATLESRLRAFFETYFEAVRPYHALAAEVLTAAVHPSSPLNPFSARSKELRQQSIALFASMLASEPRLERNPLRTHLPLLLWLMHLGLTLYWIYDTSPRQRRSQNVAHQSAGFANTLIKKMSNPIMRGVAGSIRALIQTASRS